ncbi:MAG TPA: hypothetical protein VFV68_02265, partial [Agriterribacter sp.]|nr:hypothetical protein [Agriterribacter sp.]
MPVSPSAFFNWRSNRTIIDIRPAYVFMKGSFPGAISFASEKFHSPANLFECLVKMHFPAPVHLIDTDGSIATHVPTHNNFDFLEGGYRAYQQWRDHIYAVGPPVGIISGKTGSGKTELLRQLEKTGRQVIDLEALAMHKGSAFGGLETAQPPIEQFQYAIAKAWLSLNPALPVWMEDKGPLLGKAGIPATLYQRMANACLFELDLPFEKRLLHIKEEYSGVDKKWFRTCIKELEKRMGFSANHKALHFHETGQVDKCLG